MATEKRLIDANAEIEAIKKYACKGCENHNGIRCRACWASDIIGFLEDAPTIIPKIEITSCYIENKIPTVKMLADDGREIVICGYPVDFAEVVHGRWKAYPDEYQICGTEFVCSNCNESFVNSELSSDNAFLEMMKYCPNCGADMREGDGNG